MSNPVNVFDFVAEPLLATFLAKVVSDGTYGDVADTFKVDDVGLETPATGITTAEGQLWSNMVDDFIKAAYPILVAGVSGTSRAGGYTSQAAVPFVTATNAFLDVGAGLTWEIGDAASDPLLTIAEDSAGGTTRMTVGSDVDEYRNDAGKNGTGNPGNEFATGATFETEFGTNLLIGFQGGGRSGLQSGTATLYLTSVTNGCNVGGVSTHVIGVTDAVTGDTEALVEWQTGSGPGLGSMRTHVGSRNPTGLVTSLKGSVYHSTPAGGGSDGGLFLQRVSADSASWRDIGGVALRYTTGAAKIANYTAVVGDHVRTDASSGTFVVGFPANPLDNDRVGVVDVAKTGTAITMDTPDASTIVDPTTGNVLAVATIPGNLASVVFKFDATSNVWRIE